MGEQPVVNPRRRRPEIGEPPRRIFGSPWEMRPTWDEAWLAVADIMAMRSICNRAGVGAVIVTAENRVVATGYNGPPASLWSRVAVAGKDREVDCLMDCPRASKGADEPLDPSYDDCITIHAEMNALAFCDRTAREGGTLYVTGSICYGCAKVVANSGLKRVVFRLDRQAEAHRNPDRVIEFLQRCGLKVVPIETKEKDA